MDMMPLKDIIPDTLKKMGINKKIHTYSVMENWDKIVGKEISDNSWPAKVERGTLVLRVKNSVWSHHLLMLKKELIKKINNHLKGEYILDIWFMAGYNKNQREIKEENINKDEIRPLHLNVSEIAAAKEMVAQIKDEKMRNKLAYVIIKEKAVEKAKKEKGWIKCKNCEVLISPEKKYCTICSLTGNNINKTPVNKKEAESSKNLEKIKKMLWDAPWLSYAEVNKYIPCLPQEYENAKKKIIQVLIKKLLKSEFCKDKTYQPALTMLLGGIKPNNLTQYHIENTISEVKKRILKKAGRKRHVSTSWN